MYAPFTTFIASGKTPTVRFKQSPHLLSTGEWYLQIHSITFGQLPTINALIQLGSNIVQPNQALLRQVPKVQERVTQIQPLKVFQVNISENNLSRSAKYVQDLTKIEFTEGVCYKVNRVKDYIEFNIDSVNFLELPPELENIPVYIHASLYKK